MKQLWLVLTVTCFLTSCIKLYTPEMDRYEDLLVVDGGVNDGPGPYTVRISRSARLEQKSSFIPYSKCKVTIKDDIGNLIPLNEYPAGNYFTDSVSLLGTAGRKYQLSILTPDGESYESEEEQLTKGLGIQNVYAEQQHKTDPKLFFGRDGYQFYVDTEMPDKNEQYLFWRVQCTYKFKADLSITSYYDNGTMHPVFEGDSLKTCYKTVDVLDFFMKNANNLKAAEVKRIPLNFEDNYTKALSIRYSLKVSQFTLNEKAYTYWSSIKKMMDEGGELYTQQPYQIKNNLRNLTHPEKPALGYFMVAGLKEKRIFVNPPPIAFRYDVCTIESKSDAFLAERFKNRPELWPVFFAAGYYIDQECMDCRKMGALTKPAFWEE